jgi:hypothetical protein
MLLSTTVAGRWLQEDTGAKSSWRGANWDSSRELSTTQVAEAAPIDS